MKQRMPAFQSYKKRQQLMTKYLELYPELEIKDTSIICRKDPFIFKFHFFQTNIEIYLVKCYHCPLDCNKRLEVFINSTELEDFSHIELEHEDMLLLAQIKAIVNDQFPIDRHILLKKLKRRVLILNFGLIGCDQVGKTTLFEIIPGKIKPAEDLIQSNKKEINSFPPLKVNLFDYSATIMANLASSSPAPLLRDKLRDFYLYIIVTDSSPQNVATTNQLLIPKLQKLSPYAAIIIIANKQDLPQHLSTEIIERIFGKRTYPLTALSQEAEENFLKILNEIILLRREQMQEYNCPFLTESNTL